MDKRSQLLAVLLGALIGSLATYYLTPKPQVERFSEVVKPDMPEVSDISVAEAEFLRAGRYENITTIEETLALPTDFAETEALYTIAGRADSAGVQDLIYQAARIGDRTDRQAALGILFLRLTELDPKSALVISRTPTFRSDTRYENQVWLAWGRLDMPAALAEAQRGTAAQKNFAAQSLYASARGLENDNAELIYAALRLKPGRNAKLQHLYALADLSPADAIRYAESLPTAAEQREQIAWLASYLAKSMPTQSNYAALVQSPANRQFFEQSFVAQAAAVNPEAALQKALAGPLTPQSQQQAFSALRQLASQDPSKAIEYLEQMPSSSGARQQRAIVAATIAASDPEMALAWARDNDSSADQSLLTSVLGQISRLDPQLALSEAQSLDSPQARDRVVSAVAMSMAESNPEQAIQVLGQVSSEQMKSSSASQIAAHWAQVDFDGATNWVASLDEDTKRRTLDMIGQRLVHSDLEKAIDLVTRFPGYESPALTLQIAQNLTQSQSTDAALSFIGQYKNKPEFGQLQSVVIGMTASSDPARAMRMAEGIEDEQARNQLYSGVIGQLAATDPQQALQWMSSISTPDARSAAMAQVAMQWYARDPSSASAWIDGLPRGSDRDDAIVATISAGRESHESVGDLIATIGDEQKRKQATMGRIQHLMFTDRVAAEQLLEESDMTDEEREHFKNLFNRIGYDYSWRN